MPARVYVIELSRSAGRRRDPRIPWVYVGSSARDPEIRFEQHRRGYRSSGLVKRFAVRLRPDLYEDLRACRGSSEARRAELERARELAGAGFVAHSDGVSYGRDAGGWAEWGAARLEPVAGHVDAAAAQLIASSFEPLPPGALRAAPSRRARLLGRRLHRPGRPAARLRPLRARRPRRARAASRAAGRDLAGRVEQVRRPIGVRALDRQQPRLGRRAPGRREAAELAAGGDDPVAGDDDRESGYAREPCPPRGPRAARRCASRLRRRSGFRPVGSCARPHRRCGRRADAVGVELRCREVARRPGEQRPNPVDRPLHGRRRRQLTAPGARRSSWDRVKSSRGAGSRTARIPERPTRSRSGRSPSRTARRRS